MARQRHNMNAWRRLPSLFRVSSSFMFVPSYAEPRMPVFIPTAIWSAPDISDASRFACPCHYVRAYMSSLTGRRYSASGEAHQRRFKIEFTVKECRFEEKEDGPSVGHGAVSIRAFVQDQDVVEVVSHALQALDAWLDDEDSVVSSGSSGASSGDSSDSDFPPELDPSLMRTQSINISSIDDPEM